MISVLKHGYFIGQRNNTLLYVHELYQLTWVQEIIHDMSKEHMPV